MNQDPIDEATADKRMKEFVKELDRTEEDNLLFAKLEEVHRSEKDELNKLVKGLSDRLAEAVERNRALDEDNQLFRALLKKL